MDKETDKEEKVESLFEKARQAAPVLSMEDAVKLVSLNAEKVLLAHKKTLFRKNTLRILFITGVILLFYFGYTYYLTKHLVPEPVAVLNTGKLIESKTDEEKNTILSGQLEIKTDNASFPPVYKEENITKPIPDKKPIQQNLPVPQKTRSETDGPATISFLKDEKRIKMILYFGEIKELRIDEEIIDPIAYSDYTEIIQKGKTMEINSRREKEDDMELSDLEREQKRQNEVVLNTIMRALAKDELIIDGKSFDFRLLWYKLVVNGITQSNESYEKYKAIYEEASGKRLTEKSNVHIMH